MLLSYGLVRSIFTCSLAEQLWLWSCQWLPSSSSTTPDMELYGLMEAG